MDPLKSGSEVRLEGYPAGEAGHGRPCHGGSCRLREYTHGL